MLDASATADSAASPPFSSAARAVRTAERAAERASVLIVVRRVVWRMRLSAERFRFFVATAQER
jgi:hypothetical protein